MQANDKYILLLTKRFSGDINSEESAELQEWLNRAPDNERLAADLLQLWEKSGTYGKSFTPDLDAAFSKVQSRIKQEAQPRARVVPMGRYLLRVAAAFALLVAGTWVYKQVSQPESIRVMVDSNDKKQIELPDGTRAWLRKNSTLEYPARFEGAERHVSLSGEAYFEVAHDALHPFIVDVHNGDRIKVLGTEFGVRLSDNEQRTDVFVRSGRVLFSPEMQPDGIVLTAREKASYDRNSPRLSVEKSATLNELAWQTGGLEFVSTPMEKVISDLESHYKVKIALENPAMRTCPHTALHTTQPIEKVLESLALTHQLRVKSPAPGQYQLSGGNCQ
jgi:ferric-dicitrate binding protein FerR (iron transport regulator)